MLRTSATVDNMASLKSAVDWTPERTGRLWTWASTVSYAKNLYFTANVGTGLVNFLSQSGRLRGRLLDYGCGAGNLIGFLLDRGVACFGVDTSAASIAIVNTKFRSRPNWNVALVTDGDRVPYAENTFDVVTFIETLEHLPDELLVPTIAEIRRVLRPGGTLVLTTPHAENLDVERVYCPFCDSAFHRWQHMRMWTAPSLIELLETNGFNLDYCRNMDFGQFQIVETLPSQWQLVTLNQLQKFAGARLRQALDRRFPRQFPNARETQFRLRAGHGRHLCAMAVKA